MLTIANQISFTSQRDYLFFLHYLTGAMLTGHTKNLEKNYPHVFELIKGLNNDQLTVLISILANQD